MIDKDVEHVVLGEIMFTIEFIRPLTFCSLVYLHKLSGLSLRPEIIRADDISMGKLIKKGISSLLFLLDWYFILRPKRNACYGC